MPYATPMEVAVAVPQLPPSSDHHHHIPRSSSSPVPSVSFDYSSNASAVPLSGVPRSKAHAAKIRLVIPSPTSDLPTSSTGSASSEPKRERGRSGGSFTLAVPSSSSSSDSSDEENRRQHHLQTGPSSWDTTAATAATATIGRKRGGEMLRTALSAVHVEPIPSVLVESPALSSPPQQVQAKRFHQAIVAGQGGVLRLNMDAIKRARTQSHGGETSPPLEMRPKYNTIGPSSASFVRKKSGELVKPALRHSSRTSSSASLYAEDEDNEYALATTPMSGLPATPYSTLPMFRRNSAPTTPTPKAVHFDSQLEHVKLFLAEQKPAAVSRDGSPNAYASTTEDEAGGYFWSGFRRGGKDKNNKEEGGELVIKVIDGVCEADKVAERLERDDGMNVKLETIAWAPQPPPSVEKGCVDAGRSLKGTILVRNLAFDKRVAARFTMDWWQTTSEVAAKYVHPQSASLSPIQAFRDPTRLGCDRFEFCIKLGDVMSKIEERTVMLCVRFGLCDGSEWWDNNEGRNYMIGFERKAVAAPLSAPASTVASAPAKDAAPAAPPPLQRFHTAPPVTIASTRPRSESPTKRNLSPTKESAAPWSPQSNQMTDLRKELEKAFDKDEDDDARSESVKTRRKPVFRREALPFSQLVSSGASGKKGANITLASLGIPAGSNASSPSLSPAPLPASPSHPDPPSLTQERLSSRYDFNASLRAVSSWKPPALPNNNNDLVFPSQRNKSPSGGGSVPFPSGGGSPERPRPGLRSKSTGNATLNNLALGSPRDVLEKEDDLPFDSAGSATRRNHHRYDRHHERTQSYFDGWVETVRKQTAAAEAAKVDDVDEPEKKEFTPPTTMLMVDDEDEATEKEEDSPVARPIVMMTTPSNTTSPDVIATPVAGATSSFPLLSPRYNSFPPVRPSHYVSSPSTASSILSPPPSSTDLSGLLSPLMGSSIASTPSATSASSPSPSSHSPSSPPHSLPLSPSADLNVSALLGLDGAEERMGLDYNMFVNRFCFYTGGGDGANTITTNTAVTSPAPEKNADVVLDPRRIHSESEVGNYFAMHNQHQNNAYGNNAGYGYGYNSPPLHNQHFGSWGSGLASGHTTPTGRSPGNDKDSKGNTTPRPGTPAGTTRVMMPADVEMSLTAAVAALALNTSAAPTTQR